MHEYITRLKQLNEDIAAAWQASDRINALKLSIQAAKLLRDSSVPTFFPVLFVLVCDILDTIGRLVFERIRAKAERDDDDELIEKLPEGFTCDDVREEAKVTCRNWFRRSRRCRSSYPRLHGVGHPSMLPLPAEGPSGETARASDRHVSGRG